MNNYYLHFSMFSFFFLIYFSTNAQLKQTTLKDDLFKKCATMEVLQERLQNDATYRAYHQSIYTIPKASNSYKKNAVLNEVIIPVAFHFAPNIVSCGDESCFLNEVEDQMDALNAAFGDNTNTDQESNCPSAYQNQNGNSVASTGTKISFCYAVPPQGNNQGLDPLCDPPITLGAFTSGSSFGGTGAPGWEGILNIFIANIEIENEPLLGVSDGLPGVANGDGVTVAPFTFGGLTPSSGCGLDNSTAYGLGITLVHEIGHYLGLFHTFEGSCNDEPNNAGPFNVDDTPPQETETAGCPTSCNSSCGVNTATANYMDYSNDACMSMFTFDQAIVLNYWANELFGNASNTACNNNQNPGALTSLCNGASCTLVCPSSVINTINVVEAYCGTNNALNFPNPKGNGLVLDNFSNDQKYVWSENGYLSSNGTVVNSPSAIEQTCNVKTSIFYLNIDCNSAPLATLLQGGTYTINIYPKKPANLASLISISNEDNCSEPLVKPIAGCTDYVNIMPFANNPSFPVSNNITGTAQYTITYIPNNAGPNCCTTLDTASELILNGDFEAGTTNWLEAEELPVGTTNPSPAGIIGISGNYNASIYDSSDAWFGAWGQNSKLSISQNIVIPDCNILDLSFDYGSFSCDGLNGLVLKVYIGGIEVANINCANSSGLLLGDFGPFNIKSFNIPVGANTLLIEGLETGTTGSSIIIDNVSLVSSDCGNAIDCDEIVSANYNCSTNCVPNLTFSGIQNTVAVYQAASKITSTATVSANISYRAGSRVNLDSGFSTGNSNNFSAYIQACD